MANKYDPRRPHDPTEKFSSERAVAIREAAESARQMEMRSFTSGGMNVQRNTRSNIQARFANQMSLADAIERDERKSFGAPGIRATRLAKETEQRAVRADNKRPYDERRGFVGPPSSLARPQQQATSTTSPQSTPVTPPPAREFSPVPQKPFDASPWKTGVQDFSNRVLEEARKRFPLNAIAAPAAAPVAPAQAPPAAQTPSAAPTDKPGAQGMRGPLGDLSDFIISGGGTYPPQTEEQLQKYLDDKREGLAAAKAGRKPGELSPDPGREYTESQATPDPVGELLPEPERPYRFPHKEFPQPTIAEPQPGPLQNIPTDPEELNRWLDERIPDMDPGMRAAFLSLDPAGREIFMREELLNYFERAKNQQIGGNMDPAAVAEAKAIPMHPWASPEGDGPLARAVSATAKQITDPLNAILDPIFGVGSPIGPPLPADISVRNLERADTPEKFERERLLASRSELQGAFLDIAAGGRIAGGPKFNPQVQGTSPQPGTARPKPGSPALVVQGPNDGSRNTKGFPVRPAPAPVDPLTTLAAESAKAQQAAPAPAPAAPAPVAGAPGTTTIQTPTGPQVVPAPKPVDPSLGGKQIDIPAPASAPTTQATKTVKPPVDPVEALVPTPVKAPAPAAVKPTPPAPDSRAPFTQQQQVQVTKQLGSGFPTRVTDLFKSGFTAAELQAEVAAGRMKLTGQGETQLIQLATPQIKAQPKAAAAAPAQAPAKAPDPLDTLATEAKSPTPTTMKAPTPPTQTGQTSKAPHVDPNGLKLPSQAEFNNETQFVTPASQALIHKSILNGDPMSIRLLYSIGYTQKQLQEQLDSGAMVFNPTPPSKYFPSSYKPTDPRGWEIGRPQFQRDPNADPDRFPVDNRIPVTLKQPGLRAPGNDSNPLIVAPPQIKAQP